MRRTLIVAVLCAGCAGRTPEVVNVRQVSSSSSRPAIAEIIDLATAGIPPSGPLLVGRGDGHAVVGELVLVKGSDFGKQPTVSVDGMAAEVVGHVSGGGLVARVPWGINPGSRDFEVQNQHGSDRAAFPVRRLIAIADDKGLTLAAHTESARLEKGTQIELADVRKLAVSTDGSLALAAGGNPPRLTFVDLTASPPSILRTARIPGESAIAIAVASHSPLALVLTDSHAVYVDMSRPSSPAIYTPKPLPPEVLESDPVAAALSPDGRQLAIGLLRGNRVALFSAADPAKLPAPRYVEVLPDVPLELLVDLRFSSDGNALWALSGNTAQSIDGGDQPTRISIVGLGGAGKSPNRVFEVPAVDAPSGVAIARGDPTPPGTAIRANPGKNALFVAGFSREWLTSSKPALPKANGEVVRVQSEKGPVKLAAGPWLPVSVDVAGKTAVVYALVVRRQGKGGLEKAVLVQQAWRADSPRWLGLSALVPSAGSPPPWVGELRVQP